MTTRGWSTFESIQMCEAMGITPVLTLKSAESYSDLADLVDYLYAEDGGNQWGRLRAQDGHPAPYNISWVELGAHHRAHLCVCCSIPHCASRVNTVHGLPRASLRPRLRGLGSKIPDLRGFWCTAMSTLLYEI